MNPLRYVKIGKTRVLIAVFGVVAACFLLLQSPTPSVVAAPPQAPKVVSPMLLPMVGVRISAAPSIPSPTKPHSASMFGIVDLSNCNDVTALKAVWAYDYSPFPQPCAGVESVPMIQSATNSQLVSNAGGNSQWLLGFNEPDLSGWARQTPQQGAVNWKQIEQWYPNRLLVSPSPGAWAVYDGQNWLRDFRTAYNATYGRMPRIDALGVHVYFTLATDAINRVEEAIRMSDAWGAQGVWVTEFGMPWGSCGSNSSELTEERKFLDYLNGNPKVLRYSWFGSHVNLVPRPDWYPSDWCDMSLIDNGALTPLANVYMASR
jgi:hypothetical protein